MKGNSLMAVQKIATLLGVQLDYHFWMYLNFFNKLHFCCPFHFSWYPSSLLDCWPSADQEMMITTTIIIMIMIKRWFWRWSCFWSADQSGRELLRAMPVDSHKSCFHFNAVVFQLSFEQPAAETVKTIQAYSGSEHVHKDQEPFRWGQKFIFRPQSGKSGDYRDLPSEIQSRSNTIKIEFFK